MRQLRRTAAGVAAAVVALIAAATASAQILPEQGTWLVGVYGGVYQPEYSFLDDGGTGGVRLGYAAAEKVLVTMAIAGTNLDSDDSTLSGDVDIAMFDVNTSYIFGSGAFGLELTVGGGYAWIDDSVKSIVAPGLEACATQECDFDNTWTLNAGLGPTMKLGRVIVNAQYRWRYFVDRNDDEVDGEFAVALLIPLGGRR